MKTLVTAAEASRLDATVSSGWRVAPALLMEKASLGIWNLLEPILPGLDCPGRRQCIFRELSIIIIYFIH